MSDEYIRLTHLAAQKAEQIYDRKKVLERSVIPLAYAKTDRAQAEPGSQELRDAEARIAELEQRREFAEAEISRMEGEHAALVDEYTRLRTE